MAKKFQSILFAASIIIVFTAQARPDDKDQPHGQRPTPAARPAPVMRATPNRTQAQVRQPTHTNQNRPPVQTNRPAPRQEVRRASPSPAQNRPTQQNWATPHVYAVPQANPVQNNRFLHRQHSNHWQPRYNFYGNQYHFYPYVNLASPVELSGGAYMIAFDGQNYYYDQGTFYLQDPSGQVAAIAPPLGIVVNPIATGARQVNVNGQIFYRYKGVFYVQETQGYQVVGPVEAGPDNS